MKKLLSYLYIIFLVIMFGWLIINHPPTIFKMLAFVFIMLGVIAIGVVFIWVQEACKNFLYRQRLQRLLGDMTIEEVLDQSPYEYGYVFQGDDGYRIWRKGTINEFIQSGVSKKNAQLWIVEQFFNNNRNQGIS